MIKDSQAPSIMEANILYLLIGIALITIGAGAQARNIYTGLLITEYLIVLLPTLLFLKIKGYDIGKNLKLNLISLKQAIFVVLIVICAYPIAVFLNFIALFLLSKFVEIRPNVVPIPSNYLIGFLVIALTPGICEEFMFRGMIMSSYNRLGKNKAIIYSAILFGIFHFNAQNLVGPIFLGLLFGIIAYKTNSLIATIIGHTANNTIALTIGHTISKLENQIDGATDVVVFPEGNEAVIGIIGFGVIALIFGIVLYILIKKLPATQGYTSREINVVCSQYSITGIEHKKRDIGIIEIIPIFIIIGLFIVWNYKYLFV